MIAFPLPELNSPDSDQHDLCGTLLPDGELQELTENHKQFLTVLEDDSNTDETI